MQTIYKYRVPATSTPSVIMPAFAEILSAAAIGDEIYVWARVQTDNGMVARQLAVYGTGHEMDFYPFQTRFIDTVIMDGGALVFHVFEVTGF